LSGHHAAANVTLLITLADQARSKHFNGRHGPSVLPQHPAAHPYVGGGLEFPMGIEWIAIGVVFAAGALFVGLPVGAGVGYWWRDRISRARRLRHRAEHERKDAELHRAVGALARPSAKNIIKGGNVINTDKPKQRRKKPAKSTAVIGDLPQEASQDRAS
jgi:hypothetical protein